MDKLTNYRNKIIELSLELRHCVEQCSLLVKEEKRKEEHNELRKEKEEKSP